MAAKNMVSITGYSKFVIITSGPPCLPNETPHIYLAGTQANKRSITTYSMCNKLEFAACQNLNIRSQN